MNTTHSLPHSTPEAQGIPSSAILAFLEAIEQNKLELHSFMLLRHGHCVAQGWWSPYAAEYPHMLFSLSKSFTSTAIGLAVAEGRLSVQDRVLDFFPEERPAEVSEHLAAMRVHDLLSMSTGNAEDTTSHLFNEPTGNWAKVFLNRPVEHQPGTYFVYNSGATYMLSVLVTKLTGMRLLDYLQPRLLEPLGIQGATWERCPRGFDVGGWGLKIKTDQIARFGQLYLQKGLWQGKRIIPEAWVEEATAYQVANSGENADWRQGYGYQFWRCQPSGVYRGDGAFGQYCVVMPEQDALLAITSGVANMQAVLDQTWTHLLPTLSATHALPEDQAAQAALADKLRQLALPLSQGAATSPNVARLSGNTYHFDENEQKIASLSLRFEEDRATVTLQDGQGDHQLVCGHSQWIRQETNFSTEVGRPTADLRPARPVAASGAWKDETTYEVLLRFYETPFYNTLTCRFAEDRLLLDQQVNLSFVPRERPQLVGRLVG